MAVTRGTYGTRLCRAFHNTRVDGECWLRKAQLDQARDILSWNLWHSATRYSLAVTCGNGQCINPRHMKRHRRMKAYSLWPYDHPQVLNRWALLCWFAAGNTDYQLVTIDNALQLLQQEVA